MTKQHHRILIIEDPSVHSILFESASVAYRSNTQVDKVTSFKSGLQKLTNEQYDLCFCDCHLPDCSIDEVLNALNALDVESHLVVVTSHDKQNLITKIEQTDIHDHIDRNEVSVGLIERILRCATDRKRLEAQISENQIEKKAFCYSLSHDFLGTLRRIGMLHNLLKEELNSHVELNDKEAKLFDIIESNVGSIHELVNNLYEYLSVDNIQSKFEPVDLNDIVERINGTVSNHVEKPFEVNLHDALPIVEGLESQLFVLFQNLIQNAIKYNSSDIAHVNIYLDRDVNEDFIKIDIKDNGNGLKPEDLSQIFTPFKRVVTTNNVKGTGLGLSIVERIAQKHSGTIEVSSELGQGSTFSVLLPKQQFI